MTSTETEVRARWVEVLTSPHLARVHAACCTWQGNVYLHGGRGIDGFDLELQMKTNFKIR